MNPTRLMIGTLLLMLVAGNASAIDAQGNFVTHGEISCADYVAEYDAGVRDRNGWITGYLSAYNTWLVNGREDIIEGIDVFSVFLTIANYCRRYPEEDLGSAMIELLFELEKERSFKP
jgi:hypothetical protein